MNSQTILHGFSTQGNYPESYTLFSVVLDASVNSGDCSTSQTMVCSNIQISPCLSRFVIFVRILQLILGFIYDVQSGEKPLKTSFVEENEKENQGYSQTKMPSPQNIPSLELQLGRTSLGPQTHVVGSHEEEESGPCDSDDGGTADYLPCTEKDVERMHEEYVEKYWSPMTPQQQHEYFARMEKIGP